MLACIIIKNFMQGKLLTIQNESLQKVTLRNK